MKHKIKLLKDHTLVRKCATEFLPEHVDFDAPRKRQTHNLLKYIATLNT